MFVVLSSLLSLYFVLCDCFVTWYFISKDVWMKNFRSLFCLIPNRSLKSCGPHSDTIKRVSNMSPFLSLGVTLAHGRGWDRVHAKAIPEWRCTGPVMFHVGLKPQKNTTQESFDVADSSGSPAQGLCTLQWKHKSKKRTGALACWSFVFSAG